MFSSSNHDHDVNTLLIQALSSVRKKSIGLNLTASRKKRRIVHADSPQNARLHARMQLIRTCQVLLHTL